MEWIFFSKTNFFYRPGEIIVRKNYSIVGSHANDTPVGKIPSYVEEIGKKNLGTRFLFYPGTIKTTDLEQEVDMSSRLSSMRAEEKIPFSSLKHYAADPESNGVALFHFKLLFI